MGLQRKPMSEGRLTRRQVIVGTGAASGAMVMGVPLLANAKEPGEWLGGTLNRVEGDRSFLINVVRERGAAPDTKHPVRVVARADAIILRDGSASVADFAQGEEISAGGDWADDGSFSAYAVESVFRTLEADVDARERGVLETAQGDIVITDRTKPRGGVAPSGARMDAEPIDSVSVGATVAVLGRLDPKTKRVEALQLGVVD